MTRKRLFTDDQIRKIRFLATRYSYTDVGKEYNVCGNTIRAIYKHETYKDVPDYLPHKDVIADA